MPTYEYECLKCNERLEVFQKISEPSLKACPQCNGTLRRLISTGAGLIFKGSGFYSTDYKKRPTEEKCSTLQSKDKNTKHCDSKVPQKDSDK